MAGIIGRPLVAFGREICGDLNAGLRREWLVANGLGGYASGTVAGVNTRRYHGLLVAALAPPVGRTVLVGGLVEWATSGGRRFALSTHEFGDGTIHPRGFVHLAEFALEGAIPVWTFALGDALLERRVWMTHGFNTTWVMYRLARGGPIDLEIVPLVTHRDFHALTSGSGWRPSARPVGAAGVLIKAFDGATPVGLACDGGRFDAGGDWYWNFLHREETARGLDDRADLFAPGTFRATLHPGLESGAGLTLCFSTEDVGDPHGPAALTAERDRQAALLRRAGVADDDPALQQLVLAADQFIVERRPAGRSIIAGYHWFNDWGRDTMIALPGLCLAPRRFDDAAAILSAFAPYVAGGLLPNNFPDRPDADPGYNTVDAALWYVAAVDAHRLATGDEHLAETLLPVMRSIVDAYASGTRYGIGMDPVDGLLRAGEAGVQLTWMDAKVGDWVVTPRIGKPVEINALWYNALCIVAAALARHGQPYAVVYEFLADRVRASFRRRFVRTETGSGEAGPGRGDGALADVVDGPGGDDWSIRPNQIFAVSLPHPLLEGDDAARVVDAVGRYLLTTYGLRSLAPDDSAYHGTYGGDQARRDAAYHRGTVWAWLLGPYIEALFRTSGDRLAARALLRPLVHHLADAGLGSVSEIFEGDPPHAPRGCIAQAWSVAEVLRLWRMLSAQEAGGIPA